MQSRWVEKRPIRGSDPGMNECGLGLGRWGCNGNVTEGIDKYVDILGEMFIAKAILQEIKNRRKSIFFLTSLLEYNCFTMVC